MNYFFTYKSIRLKKIAKAGVCFVFVLLFQLTCTKSVLANAYYVSTTGNDANSGTSVGNAWRNINYAVNYAGLAGGDIVYIAGGTYFERVVMYKSGLVNNVITIKNLDANIPVINGNGQTFSTPAHQGLFEARGSYVTVDGIKVINSRSDLDATGILVAGSVSNVAIRNCITNNTSSSGIAIWGNSTAYTGATNITIEYNDVSAAVTGGYQEHLTIAGGVDNFIIRYNKVHDQTALPNSVNLPIGIDAKTNVRNGKIYRNEVYNLIRSNGIYVDGYDNTAYNIDIYDNIIHHVENTGISIGAEEGGSDYNIKVYNNLIFNTSGHGIAINKSLIATQNSIYNISIYNNTFYGCAYYAVYIDHPNTPNVVIKNNIFSQNVWGNGITLYTSNKSNVTVSNNVTNGAMNAWLSYLECYVGNSAISSLPLFADVSTNNFHLASNSPAKDAATNTLVPLTDIEGNARPSGGGYDMGAYEYVVTTAGPNNMLINPGFENPLSEGWTADWNNSSATTTEKNSGTYSLQVGPGQGGRAQVFTSGFTVGRQYKLSAYCMMSASGGPAGTNIGVVCKDASGARTGTFVSSDITNTGSFVQKSVTFTIPLNTISLEVNVWYPGGTPVVYVDDFFFNEVVSVLALGTNNNRNNNASSNVNIFSVYPNPAKEMTTIDYGVKNNCKVQILLYDTQGKMLAVLKNQEQQKGRYQIKLNTNPFSNGLYFIKMSTNDTEETKKLIINK